MEEKERAGEKVGQEGPSHMRFDPRERLFTIKPLRTNCYKLWLEVPSHLGPIRSKPVFLTPNDHGERRNLRLNLLRLSLCLLMCSCFYNHSFFAWIFWFTDYSQPDQSYLKLSFISCSEATPPHESEGHEQERRRPDGHMAASSSTRSGASMSVSLPLPLRHSSQTGLEG